MNASSPTRTEPESPAARTHRLLSPGALPAPERRDDAPDRRAEEAEERARSAERRTAAIERALTTRGPIEQAKGLLMGVFGLGADGAFDALVWVSQHANTRLATVAEAFVEEVRRTGLGEAPQEELTRLLDELGRHGTPRTR